MPNRDFLNKRTEDVNATVEKFFGLARQDWVIFMLVLSLLCNIFLVVEIISTTKDYSREIAEEIRRQVPREVEQQVIPMKTKVDTLVEKVSSAIEENSNEE